MPKTFWLIGPLLLFAVPAFGEAPHPLPAPGDVYEIIRTRNSVQATSDDTSSGSSNDRDTIIERVVAVREDGLELEYDLPADPNGQGRRANWQLPARIFKPFHGPAKLLNAAELEARVDGWLKAGKMTRAACGHWIFTWNAFQIECDPSSAIGIIDGFDLGPGDLRAGILYQEKGALGPVPLKDPAGGAKAGNFVAEMEVDPDALRRARAESDVVVGEITGKAVRLDAALAARAREDISGTVTTTFKTDTAGRVQQKTIVSKIAIKDPSGKVQTETVTTVIARRKAARQQSQDLI
ncbi:hypothetical protein [Sphingomonas psychrolutea]|uniref:Uncharacterized protein n=1 Tax=Sphingomonas psychrolutea TaxID=1259676 RepID=A0ABQ1G942_9SPHN|nr:hypothetical protein [Sphingomonas psychrolutea]GGA39117.1 hypothetical protein GCM10011395_06680 [Sphingomonas psychrolutea]